MDKEQYAKFKSLMDAIKDIDYDDVSISDYEELQISITFEKDINRDIKAKNIII